MQSSKQLEVEEEKKKPLCLVVHMGPFFLLALLVYFWPRTSRTYSLLGTNQCKSYQICFHSCVVTCDFFSSNVGYDDIGLYYIKRSILCCVEWVGAHQMLRLLVAMLSRSPKTSIVAILFETPFSFPSHWSKHLRLFHRGFDRMVVRTWRLCKITLIVVRTKGTWSMKGVEESSHPALTPNLS